MRGAVCAALTPRGTGLPALKGWWLWPVMSTLTKPCGSGRARVPVSHGGGRGSSFLPTWPLGGPRGRVPATHLKDLDSIPGCQLRPQRCPGRFRHLGSSEPRMEACVLFSQISTNQKYKYKRDSKGSPSEIYHRLPLEWQLLNQAARSQCRRGLGALCRVGGASPTSSGRAVLVGHSEVGSLRTVCRVR